MSNEPAALPTLMCPRCRRPPHGWPIIHDGLRCSNVDCEHDFATLEATNIPIVLSGSNAPFLDLDAAVDFRDFAAVSAWLEGLDRGSAQWELALRTGMYAASHYGSADPLAARVFERFVTVLPTPPRTVLELGCGVGGFSNLMASSSSCNVVGLDGSGLALRFAASAAIGGPIAIPELSDGVRLVARRADLRPSESARRARWVCADAHDPPLVPASFDLVVALNLFDSTPEPTIALGQAAALVAPGGHLLMAQPDAWNTHATPAAQWLPSTDVTWDGLLAAYGLQTVDREDGFVWRLQRTPRYRFEYVSHARLARRADPPA